MYVGEENDLEHSAVEAGRATAHTTQHLSMAEFAGFRNAVICWANCPAKNSHAAHEKWRQDNRHIQLDRARQEQI